MEQNCIEKHVDLKTSPSRVWKALTDYKEFGQWFGVKLAGPFIVGQTVAGKLTISGYEHMQWAVDVKKMEPERLFSFTWHPYAIDVAVDYSKETPTLVEFTLEASGSGTHLVVTESGFEKIPLTGGSRPSAWTKRVGSNNWRILPNMSDSVFPQGFFLQAHTFAALGDETRLSLIAKLCRVSQQSISQLAEGTNLTRQAVTKHLQVLQRVGLVRSLRKGRETLFEFDAAPIETMTQYLDLVSDQWEKKLTDLQTFLDE